MESKLPLSSRILMALTYRNGQFSKTAMFTSAANILVMASYVLSWGAGATVTLDDAFSFTVPAFDTSAAISLLTIVNGTYLGNNYLKGHPAKPVSEPAP